ncbi:hsp90-like protein [Microdochium bolleyi]|uniref:histidine kinase n=1 Tax=Microdochium bolleyi TaxID=196109 RepID=A0A136J1V6_9PEZI|nr:hsp90-like protein [Microdochium bolleyi]
MKTPTDDSPSQGPHQLRRPLASPSIKHHSQDGLAPTSRIQAAAKGTISVPNPDNLTPPSDSSTDLSPSSSSSYSQDDRFFAAPDAERSSAPSRSSRSGSASPFRLALPMITPGQLAFSALQFLPVPVIVLDNLKTVVMANGAMGRLLGFLDDAPGSLDDPSFVLDKLRGQSLSQVGVDIVDDGKPVWISWDAFFDELAAEQEVSQAADSTATSVSDDTPTISEADAYFPRSPSKEKGPKNRSSAVDVIILSAGYNPASGTRSKSASHTSAKMLITIWELETHQTYYTLTFTNTDSTPPPALGPRISVARPSTLEAAERRSITSSNPTSSVSSHGSNSTSFRISPGSVAVSSAPFPPMGPPSRLSQSSTPSALLKITVIKDALLDNTETPILAMWKDGTAPVLNRAARELIKDTRATATTDGLDLLAHWDLWTEDFSRLLTEEEFPINVLLREQLPFSGMRVGMINRRMDRKLIFDILGEVITDDDTGEVVAGVVTCRDVTNLTNEITQIREADEERFQVICDSMPQMIWTTTPEGLHDYFNNRWYEYTGLIPENSLGLGWKLPFHPDDMATTGERWQHSLATGDPYMTHYRCLSKDGEWRWMLGRALPLRNKHTGEITKWFGTCTDVHEALEAQIAAEQTNSRLKTVLGHAQTTIFTVDRQARLSMLEGAMVWNLQNGRTKQFDSTSCIGRNVDDVFKEIIPNVREDEATKFLAGLHDLLAGRRARDVVIEHPLGDRFYRTRFLPFRDHNPQTEDLTAVASKDFDGVIAVVTDVTELKKSERDLKIQVKEKRQLVANEAAAKEASRLKSQFLANMSHEIRTPITGVIGMAELLLDLPLGEEQKEYALNIGRSANALLTVINDILDFSKVESGRLDIEEVQFSLSVVVQDVSKMLSFAAERKHLDFRSDISQDIADGLVVLGDPGRVRQIMTNLLTNSIKFTNQGHVSFSVLKEREYGDTIEIKFVVEDTGIGIDDDVQKRLFRPFSQGDPSTARKFGGTGLGLTISKNLLELMRGRMQLQSTPGNGTTATFWIPFTKSNSPQDAALVEIGALPDRLHSELSVSCNSSDHDHGGNTAGDGATGNGDRTSSRAHRGVLPVSPLGIQAEDMPRSERAKIQILVVEDNAINQQIATKTIEKLGFGVSAAWNGKEALEYLEACQQGKHPKPDIILMDVQMPVIDGYRCTHILRHHLPYKSYAQDVPIVAMTASAIQGDKEKCAKAGMDDYLAKPVKSTTLEQMLVRWSKTTRSSTPHLSRSQSHSDCSESTDHCFSTDIPKFGFSSPLEAQKDQRRLSDSTSPVDAEDRHGLPTPRPLAPKPGTHEMTGFPFGLSQVSRQLDTNELAMQLRDDKLLGAASSGEMSMASPSPNALPEGDSLTEANIERLSNQEGSKPATTKTKSQKWSTQQQF